MDTFCLGMKTCPEENCSARRWFGDKTGKILLGKWVLVRVNCDCESVSGTFVLMAKYKACLKNRRGATFGRSEAGIPCPCEGPLNCIVMLS